VLRAERSDAKRQDCLCGLNRRGALGCDDITAEISGGAFSRYAVASVTAGAQKDIAFSRSIESVQATPPES
jgi:hypothetical protein